MIRGRKAFSPDVPSAASELALSAVEWGKALMGALRAKLGLFGAPGWIRRRPNASDTPQTAVGPGQLGLFGTERQDPAPVRPPRREPGGGRRIGFVWHTGPRHVCAFGSFGFVSGFELRISALPAWSGRANWVCSAQNGKALPTGLPGWKPASACPSCRTDKRPCREYALEVSFICLFLAWCRRRRCGYTFLAGARLVVGPLHGPAIPGSGRTPHPVALCIL